MWAGFSALDPPSKAVIVWAGYNEVDPHLMAGIEWAEPSLYCLLCTCTYETAWQPLYSNIIVMYGDEVFHTRQSVYSAIYVIHCVRACVCHSPDPPPPPPLAGMLGTFPPTSRR